MGGLTLGWFDVEGLVSKINSALANQDELIELGEFRPQERPRNSLLDRLDDKEIEASGSYPLTQPFYLGFLTTTELDRDIGHVYVEKGYFDASTSDPGTYETLKLRIRKPIELKNGLVIPNSGVNVAADAEAFGEPNLKRKDRIRRLRMIWSSTDLSRQIPTEWILSEDTSRLAAGQAQPVYRWQPTYR